MDPFHWRNFNHNNLPSFWPNFNHYDIPFDWRYFNEADIPTTESLMAAGADPRFTAYLLEGHTDDEQDDEEDDDDEEYVPDVQSPRVSNEAPRNSTSDEAIVILDDERQSSVENETNKRRRTEAGEASSSSLPNGSADGSQENECNLADIDGLICPICMDAWTDKGDHHVWCKC